MVSKKRMAQVAGAGLGAVASDRIGASMGQNGTLMSAALKGGVAYALYSVLGKETGAASGVAMGVGVDAVQDAIVAVRGGSGILGGQTGGSGAGQDSGPWAAVGMS